MSREIKFRAWVFDDYSGKRKMIAANQIKLCGDFAYVYCAEDDYEYQINTPDLSQYTGLKDRTGREIYEGDIISDGHGNNLIVEWSNDSCEFWLFHEDETHGLDISVKEWGTVIGNIYENPDLLKP